MGGQLVRVLRLQKNTPSSPQNQVITVGTANRASHRITEWVSFVLGSGGINRHVHAIARPEKGITNDLFMLLRLPWLYSVKAVIGTTKSQLRIGDKKKLERNEPLKTPLEGILKVRPCDRDGICNEVVPLNCSNTPKVHHPSSYNISGVDDVSKFTHTDNVGDCSSSEDSKAVVGSDYERNLNHNQYISAASTDLDHSTEDGYSTGENPDDSMKAHSISQDVPCMTVNCKSKILSLMKGIQVTMLNPTEPSII